MDGLPEIDFNGYKALFGVIAQMSEDEQRGHFRNLCRNDLYFLIRYGMARKDVEKRWLFDRCREVQAEPNGCLDLWAREHYKSTIITVGKTIQDVFRSHGENAPESECLTAGIFSHTRPIAKAFLAQIKREFEGNLRFKEWFDDILWENTNHAPNWSLDNGITVKRDQNPKEATIEAYGLVDGQPTGKHFNLLVYDDIVTSKSVYTPEMIKKTSDELKLSYNLGAHGGDRRFIGTRYSFGDTYKEVIEAGTAKVRVHAATKDGTQTGEPVFLSRELLAQKRRDMGEFIFSCQMLQNPVAGSEQKFKEEWLNYHTPTVQDRDRGHNYILVDPASSKKKVSDYTVMWVVQARADKRLYVMDGVRDRLNLTERAEKLVELHRKWKPMQQDGVRYEQYGAQSDIEAIKMFQESIGYRFDITKVGGKVAKFDRVMRLVPYFESGKLILPHQIDQVDYEGKTSNIITTLVKDEYLIFPACSHDDGMDGLARAVDPDLPLIYPETDLYSSAEHVMGGSSGGMQDWDMEDFLLG